MRCVGKHKGETRVVNSELPWYLVWSLHPVLEPVCRVSFMYLHKVT